MEESSDHTVCKYCGSLKHAIKGDHNCSVTGTVHPSNSMGNSFYIKTRNLTSDIHLSRTSFRTVLKGYQHYSVNDRDFMLNADNYIVVQNGTKYHNEIATCGKTESIIVVFGDRVQKEAELTHYRSANFLIDNVDYVENKESIDFVGSSYPTNKLIQEIVEKIKHGIKIGDKDPLYFQQTHYDLMGLMVENHLGTIGRSTPDYREATKRELYRRTRLALDYIEANFSKRITLNQLSREASLSPFHFLRTFKEFYKISPGEYLTKTRLKYAQYLLVNSFLPITEVLQVIGFKNHSSFARLFKSYHLHTPSDYRALYHKSNIRTIVHMSD